MSDDKNCGACAHWAHAKKRQCSVPETPIYYAECLFPFDGLVLPHSVSFDDTYENSGATCPCFVPLGWLAVIKDKA